MVLPLFSAVPVKLNLRIWLPQNVGPHAVWRRGNQVTLGKKSLCSSGRIELSDRLTDSLNAALTLDATCVPSPGGGHCHGPSD